jgi:uncharacterized protein (DUF2141 family)
MRINSMNQKFLTSSLFSVAALASINLAVAANAEPTATLTVVVNGLKQHKSQICLRVYSNERGFPNSNESEVQSGCIPNNGTSVKKQFSGLKYGTYAVAIVDDENRDAKLNTNFLGIPEEGFGISRNPTVSITTGSPKFTNASFALRKNTTINIKMKYSLDS